MTTKRSFSFSPCLKFILTKIVLKPDIIKISEYNKKGRFFEPGLVFANYEFLTSLIVSRKFLMLKGFFKKQSAPANLAALTSL